MRRYSSVQKCPPKTLSKNLREPEGACNCCSINKIVYFDKGKFVAAYAVNNHSFACLAFKIEKDKTCRENSKEVFEEHFKSSGWEISRLIGAMKESNDCYFGSTTQTRMPLWSKGRIGLVGDAAYSAQGIGTSLAMVGAYVLAREIGEALGDYSVAFPKYEESIRKFVEKGTGFKQTKNQS